jgi:hypothetical protein
MDVFEALRARGGNSWVKAGGLAPWLFSPSTPLPRRHCISMLDSFDFRDHICMVLPLLGVSFFDFMSTNSFRPFDVRDVRSFAVQLLDGIACAWAGRVFTLGSADAHTNQTCTGAASRTRTSSRRT